MDSPAVRTQDLTKSFGATRALDGFTIEVPAGQVAGFLGPNGAGKSTTIRILLGLLRADAGTAEVLGQDPWRDAVELHRRIAYVPGDTNLWPNLTGGEIIDLLTRAGTGGGPRARLSRRAERMRRAELLERFDLDPTKKARSYSKGNRQKVALVAALASNAELFLFDEPTAGLDPLMEAVFTEEVRFLKREGRTVLLSSHILAEAEKLCDAVTIIRAGRDVESGTLAELRHLTRSTVTATCRTEPTSLSRLTGVRNLQYDDGRLRFDVEDAGVGEVLRALAELKVQNLSISPPSLEELFLRHYGEQLPAEEGAAR